MREPNSPSVPGGDQDDSQHVVDDDGREFDREFTWQIDLRQRDRDQHATRAEGIGAANQGRLKVNVVQRTK